MQGVGKGASWGSVDAWTDKICYHGAILTWANNAAKNGSGDMYLGHNICINFES